MSLGLLRWPGDSEAGPCRIPHRGGWAHSCLPGVQVGGWSEGILSEKRRQDHSLEGEAGHLAGLGVHGLVWGTG